VICAGGHRGAAPPSAPIGEDAAVPAPYTSALAEALAPDLLERFLRYVRVDTQARRDAAEVPSSPGQLELGRRLTQELHATGLDDAIQDPHGIVFATLPGTGAAADAPAIGLIAHVDTSPDAPGAGVQPIVHRDYDGGVLRLPRAGTVLDPAAMPELSACAGHDLVSSSGDTLLGADDKAGVAEIMSAVAHLATRSDLVRPPIRVAFTCDEEIGEGATHFDVARFGARCAYTVDGSTVGELQDETFSAVEAIVTIAGVDIHPGWAKDRMVNAARLAAMLLAELPRDRLTPETTADRDGFLHPYEVTATAGRATVRFILRDFDDELLAGHVALLRETAERVVAAASGAKLDVAVREQYPNMRRHLEPFPEVTALAEAAIRAEGLEPVRTPIRGGTDGSRLSAMGLPTPNIFTGGHEYHSVREWASVHEMAAAAATLVRLAETWGERATRAAP